MDGTGGATVAAVGSSLSCTDVPPTLFTTPV
jgi:hypothetical protein